MRFAAYQTEYREPMIALHRSAIEGFDLGMTQQEDESDLMEIEEAYLLGGGEFIIGFIGERLIAMGGFKRRSDTVAELRRMRIARDLQGRGFGTQLLRELERIAYRRGLRSLRLETAKARPLTLSFYRKHGYLESGSSFYGKVETVQFVKELHAPPKPDPTTRDSTVMTFRAASLHDCGFLAELNCQLIHDEGHRNPMTVQQLGQRMRDWLSGEYQAVIFEAGKDVVAYALFRQKAEEIYLRQFFVVREKRRRGFGRRAVEILRADVWPKNKRLTVEVLVANQGAVEFWRAVGYVD